MERSIHVILVLLLIAATSRGFPAENEGLCHSSTCGLGATCSQVSNLIVCTCLDGYEGDAFKECIPAATSTTVSSQPSSSLPATTISSQTASTFASTLPTPSSTIITASTTTITTTTGTPIVPAGSAAASETVFNIPVRTHTFNEAPKAPSPQPNMDLDQYRHQQQSTRQQIPVAVVTEDVLLNQYPSAPPTLSHYAPTFQQKLQAQPIQFGSTGNSPQSQAQSHHHQSHSHTGLGHGQFGQVVQQTIRDTSASASSISHQNQNNAILFDGIRTRERPQQGQTQQDLGPINGHSNDEKYYYHDSAHQPNNRYPASSSNADGSSTQQFGSGSYNLPFSNQQNNYHGAGASSQSHSGQGGPSSIVPPPLVDYEVRDRDRTPILASGNVNRYPVSSIHENGNGNGNMNVGQDEFSDDEMRDATFIKDPLGKYEKCHTVNNIVVCAENSNSLAGSGVQHKVKHQHHSPSPTHKPMETRRIDSRPVGSNANSNNYGMGNSRIPTFPSSNRHQTQNYHQTQQQETYYPSSRYQEPGSHTQQNTYFEFGSQFFQRYPNPGSDFTSTGPLSMGSHNARPTVNTPSTSTDPMCRKFCGEGSVCRIVLERPVCGCPEGHTGDPTLRCTPILNSKYDTKSCQKHTDCSATDVCHQSRCVDPCDENARTSRSNRCGSNASCRVIEHTQLCSCNAGFNGNPYLGCT